MDKNLIIIILAAAFWILSVIISNNKKKAEAQQQNTSDDSHRATKHSNAGGFSGANSFENFPEMEMEPWSYDNQAIDEITKQSTKIDIEHLSNQSKFIMETKSENIESIKATEMLNSENPKIDAIRHFNLRDAIIYSELLKPKFEDKNGYDFHTYN